MSRASWYRHQRPGRGLKPDPVPQKDREQPAALDAAERRQIVDELGEERHSDLNVAQVRATVMDEGLYVASESTWYRVARVHRLSGDRRGTATHPPKTIPELCAVRPNQVWSWDITVLRTIDKGRNLRLYVMMDVFSRKVVGWRLEPDEKGFKAAGMLEAALIAESAVPEVLHADRGAVMIGTHVSRFLKAHGIAQSHSRPSVSNDNPFSEAQFKTMKYRLDYPGRFTDIEHARTWVEGFISYYNTAHRHSGIGYYTPASVHEGTWKQLLNHRQDLLDDHYAQHPSRYHQPPKAPTIRTESWINKPNHDKHAA
ncbi:IS3 family transposase [uncultured Arthrobacter sp.]|uniref:IS3 family transposase n=1 Tax=uncultured Arthrobacter sp. TaxID=114050 RepID=UPI0026399207|nr:IS3 family transposase [uncultured Arthrobacter sp.]